MRRFVSWLPAVLVLAACGGALVAIGPVMDRVVHRQTTARVTLARQVIQSDDILERIDRAVQAVAESVRPSVVHMDVIDGGEGRPSRSNGSGWVFDSRGHIVTNAHVVRGARRIRVEFPSGLAEVGRLVAVDPYTDIAVVRVPETAGVVPLQRASGQSVSQGQRAYAFGSPFGFKFSMSEGIVSGLGRAPGAAASFGGFTNFIQTDAAVNPGNSGGPLVDIAGRVIGMNVAIATGRDTQGTTEGDSAGISFAIPLETIESVVPQLIESGRVARGYLGVTFPRADTMDSVNLGSGEVVSGIRVSSVVEGGPSDRAGLREGDLIVRLEDQPIKDFEVLRSIVGGTEAGEDLPVTVVRDDELLELTVTLGQMPAFILAERAANSIMLRLGMFFQSGASGPEVARVIEGYPADSLGFAPGDRVLTVGGVPVESQVDIFIGFIEGNLLGGEVVPVVIRPADAPSRRETIDVRLDF